MHLRHTITYEFMENDERHFGSTYLTQNNIEAHPLEWWLEELSKKYDKVSNVKVKNV